MPDVIAGDPLLFPDDFEVPTDLDDLTAASARTGYEALANRTAYLKARAHVATGLRRFCRNGQHNSGWLAKIISGSSGGWYQSISYQLFGTDTFIWFPIEIPNGAVMTAYEVRLIGVAHGAWPGAQPAVLPSSRLYEITQSSGTVTEIDTVVNDASGTDGQYSALHTLTKTGLTLTIDNDVKRYGIQVDGEHGANAIDGLSIYGVRVTFNMTFLDEAGA